MRCDKARRSLSDDLDGILSPARKVRLEAHLAVCPACRAYLRDLGTIEAGFKDRSRDAPPAGYWTDFEERLGRRLVAAAAPPRSGRRPPVRKLAWAGAAFLVLVAAAVYVAVARRSAGPEAAWAPSGNPLASILLEAEGDTDLTDLLDREVRASIEELTVDPDEDVPLTFVDDPLFWEGLTEEDLRFIASELEAENDRGVSP